jgi:hypothetical protein
MNTRKAMPANGVATPGGHGQRYGDALTYFPQLYWNSSVMSSIPTHRWEERR